MKKILKKLNCMVRMIVPALVIFLMVSVYGYVHAENGATASEEPILDLPLEQLINVEVTSVLQAVPNPSDATTDIYVLNNEETIRNRMVTIPEALLDLLGLHIVKISANKWAVTASKKQCK